TLYHTEYQKSVWVLFQRGLPFIRLSSGSISLSIDMEEQLKSDSRLKHLPYFVILDSNDQLCDIALKMLLLFASTYLCEAGFSRLTALKTKYRNRAQIEYDLRICLSNIAPRFEDLCSAKQARVSHRQTCRFF